jgi:hypothetical protein
MFTCLYCIEKLSLTMPRLPVNNIYHVNFVLHANRHNAIFSASYVVHECKVIGCGRLQKLHASFHLWPLHRRLFIELRPPPIIALEPFVKYVFGEYTFPHMGICLM